MLPDRYNSRNLRRLLENPRVLLGECSRLGTRLNRHYYEQQDGDSGMDVIAADWDSLVLLDGCRYDLFAERTPFDEPVERRRSAGSDSREFLTANFAGRTLADTVYVTANPHAYRLDDVFHFQHNLLEDRWDPDLETVRPEAMAEAVRDAHEAFPNKRLIAHFMQPHFPFIGETGRQLSQAGVDLHLEDGARSDELDVWNRLRYGYVDRDTVWTAYRENLDIVLDVVTDLVPDLDGKTVLSTDHGNLVGDRLRPIPVRGYGHPRSVHVDALVEVPWQVLPTDERRTVRAEASPSSEQVRLSEGDVTERLRDLGYVT